MVGIVAITHGEMASGLKDATHLIMGPQENFEVVSLYEGMDLKEFTFNVLNKITEVNDEGVVVFVDMFGATPFNTVAKIKNQLDELDTKVCLITGVNLPMILETLTMRESKDFKTLSEDIVSSGKESIELIPVTGADE
jgi:PTS system mannose-specific IIA component